ncbi:hypothetical protein K493DRAFT_406882, partial [Basidiobolus meristosporus CBS 931.73]
MKISAPNLSLFLAFTTTAVAFSCAKLSQPSGRCQDIVTYYTNVTDVAAADEQVKVLLDKISREGVEGAGADCFLALHRAACYTTFRKCDPDTNTILPVCMTIRNNALNTCETSGSFTDSNIIEENFEPSLFQQFAGKCYPDYSDEAPIVEGKITDLPIGHELDNIQPNPSDNQSSGDGNTRPNPSETQSDHTDPSKPSFPGEGVTDADANGTNSQSRPVGVENARGPAQDLAYSFSSSILATFVALCGVGVICSIPAGLIYWRRRNGHSSGGFWDLNSEYKRINVDNASLDSRLEANNEPTEPHVEMEHFFIEDEEFGEFSGEQDVE